MQETLMAVVVPLALLIAALGTGAIGLLAYRVHKLATEQRRIIGLLISKGWGLKKTNPSARIPERFVAPKAPHHAQHTY